jgi:hypothetical protein
LFVFAPLHTRKALPDEKMEQERGDDRMDMEETQTTTNNGPAPAADGGGGGAADAKPDQEAPAVKIGFSFGSSAKRKVSTQGVKKEGDEGRELVTAIQGSTMKTLFEKDDGPLVIPLPQPLRKKAKTSEGSPPLEKFPFHFNLFTNLFLNLEVKNINNWPTGLCHFSFFISTIYINIKKTKILTFFYCLRRWRGQARASGGDGSEAGGTLG